MREYELAVIYDLELAEAEGPEASVERVKSAVEAAGGTVKEVDHWGRRRMAYPINKAIDGDFIISRIEVDPASVGAIEASLKIDERAFRTLVVRADELFEITPIQDRREQRPYGGRPADGAAPATDGAAPAGDDVAAATTETATAESPAAEAEAPEAEAPAVVADAPVAAAEAPTAEAEAPVDEADVEAPAAEIEAPVAEAEAPAAEVEAPVAEVEAQADPAEEASAAEETTDTPEAEAEEKTEE